MDDVVVVVGGSLEDELLVEALAARSSRIADCMMAFKLSSVSVIVFGPPPEESDGVDVPGGGPDEVILARGTTTRWAKDELAGST